MTTKRPTVFLLLLMILVTAVQAIPAQKVTIPVQTKSGELLQLPGLMHKPDGAGPFPAVVMLCGSGGYANEPDATQQFTWAERLV
ncbi:MAG: hypothetical protein ABSG63_16420 [Spirochaetia bacterium]|jgi:hypothetical protein